MLNTTIIAVFIFNPTLIKEVFLGFKSIYMSKYTDKRNEEFESYRNPHEDERYDGYDNNETCNNKSRRGIRLLIIVLVGVMLIAVWESTSSDQTSTEEVPEIIAQKGSNIGIRQYHAANSE